MAPNLGFDCSHLLDENKESSVDVENNLFGLGAVDRLRFDPKVRQNLSTVTYGNPIKKYAQTTPSANRVSSFFKFKNHQ
jgi:hypothetical protein